MTNEIRKLSLLLSVARVAIFLVLLLTTAADVAKVSATKTKTPPPPPSSTSWATTYSVPYSYSLAESISQTSSGGFAVGGLCSLEANTTPNCTGGPATVLSVDSFGNIQAQTQYSYANPSQYTAMYILKATSDGGSIFAGQPQFGCPAENNTYCAAIVKVDSTGTVQWANDLVFATSAPRTYTSPETWPFDVQQTNDGGYVLVGYAAAPDENYNPWIAKLSSSGQIQWTHVFADPNSQYSAAYSVRQTTDGGYLVGGLVSYTDAEITVFKLDSTGNLVWQRDYAAGNDAYFQHLGLTSDGGAIVIGRVDTETGSNSYTSSVLLMKIDSSGNEQFAQSFVPSGDISDLNVVGVQQTADGGYAFAGYYFQNTVYTERAWLVKTDSGGNVQWNHIYGPDNEDYDRYFYSFQQTSDGGFIAAGAINSGGNGSLWLVKTDSSGNISKCANVLNDSAVTGSTAVTVSNGDLSAVADSFSYVPDSLIQSSAPLTATQECE